MDLELTDEQQLIRETARDFTDNEIVERARENDRNEHFDLELVAKIAAQGYLGAIVPREYGGAGLDYLTYGLIVEEVGRGDSAMRTVVSVQTSLVCSAILHWGTEEQKQHYLPKLCSGEWLGCFGLTEPDTGSDAANQQTRAKQDRQRLGDQRLEDVHLDGQPRQGRADLRADRPREGPPRASRASWSTPTSRGSSPSRSTTSWACTGRTPRAISLDDVEAPTTRCWARSATASRSR